MRRSILMLPAMALLLCAAGNASAQNMAAGTQPLTFEAPAEITVEPGVQADVRTDRRSGRARGYQRLNQYRLRRSEMGSFGRPLGSTRFADQFSGQLAFNPADPPRWQGPTQGWRNFQTRITVQHRRLFNPH